MAPLGEGGSLALVGAAENTFLLNVVCFMSVVLRIMVGLFSTRVTRGPWLFAAGNKANGGADLTNGRAP